MCKWFTEKHVSTQLYIVYVITYIQSIKGQSCVDKNNAVVR